MKSLKEFAVSAMIVLFGLVIILPVLSGICCLSIAFCWRLLGLL